MEKYNDINEFVKKIADSLLAGFIVYYDIESLRFGDVSESWFDEYDDYIDADKSEFDTIGPRKLQEWEKSLIKVVQETITLPAQIETPPSWQQFRWREEFLDELPGNARFKSSAARALSGRHPFRAFKDELNYYRIDKQWFQYEFERMEAYVRHELNID